MAYKKNFSLFLFSSYESNDDIDSFIGLQLKNKKGFFTYIPCESLLLEESLLEFNLIVQRFSKFYHRFHFLPLVPYLNKKQLEELKKSSLIFLGGGNTFHLINELRKNKLMSLLKKMFLEDVIFVGVSAGAIVLGPSLKMAQYPQRTADKNDLKIKNLKGLNFYPFYYSPHWENNKKDKKSLERLSLKDGKKIICVKDGDCLAISKEKKEYLFFSSSKNIDFLVFDTATKKYL